MRENQHNIVTASEIADFVYCPEAWRLHSVGTLSANLEQQLTGNRHHTFNAIVERIAGVFVVLGRWLILAALLVLSVLWLLSR